MNYPCTYYDIYRWNAEIIKFQQTPKSILSIIKQEDKDIIVFKNDNQIKFESVMKKIEDLNKKYFVIVKDIQQKETLEIKEGKPVFLEGMTEEEFQKELKELFNTKSSVQI